MKNKKLFFTLFCMFVLFLIFTTVDSFKESFTPGLRKIYRPYIRSGRIYTEKIYNNLSNRLHVILSKFGII